jgi:Transposase DDE domain
MGTFKKDASASKTFATWLRRTFTFVLLAKGSPITNEENGLVLRRYWTNACQSCAIKHSCTTAKERRITRWEHEHILEAVQRRLDEHPEKMRQRRETVEHPFGTIKARMGATHFLMKTLPRVATEMALHVLAYNLTRIMNIVGVQPLLAAMRA